MNMQTSVTFQLHQMFDYTQSKDSLKHPHMNIQLMQVNTCDPNQLLSVVYLFYALKVSQDTGNIYINDIYLASTLGLGATRI